MKSAFKIWGLLLAMIYQSISAQEVSDTNTVFFKITSADTEHVSYLFGTHHAFGKAFFDSLAEPNQCLSTCDLVILENVSKTGDTAEEIINQRSTSLPWRDYLNKKDLAFVENLFKLSPTDFNKMTPTEMYVFLNRYYNAKICLLQSVDTLSSLDDYIGIKANQLDVSVIGLETTQEQLEYINKDVEGMPKKIHKKRLSKIINLIENKNTTSCGETEWYSRMEMNYQFNNPCRNTLILTQRNNKWMKEIRAKLETNNCFIAVGLSHLMYDCGLISQLQDLGYTVTPIALN